MAAAGTAAAIELILLIANSAAKAKTEADQTALADQMASLKAELDRQAVGDAAFDKEFGVAIPNQPTLPGV